MVRNELKSAAEHSSIQSKEREAFLRKEIEVLNSEIEDRDKKIIEIDKYTTKITTTQEDEIKKLKEQNEVLQRKLDNSKNANELI
jgi:hypothetical protein